ncbi:MAG: spore cortex biosynthesis protein YabQ [Mobilitalea sp.]
MNHAITIELQFFLISILWGGILLLVYDGLRIVRRLIKHDSFFLAVEDLIFWVLASVFIFAMMYRENNGIIRGFSVMGMAIGMVLYHYIFSEILVNIITKFIRTLIRPFTMAYNKTKKFVLFLMSKAKNAIKLLLMQLIKWMKSVRIALTTRKHALTIKHKKNSEKKALEKVKKKEQRQVEQKSKK